MQKLEIYQSLWAMERRRPGEPEAPLEAMIDQIAAAGYEGVGLDLAMSDIPLAEAARPLLEARGLKCLFNGFPRDEGELRAMLRVAAEFGAPFLNLIAQVMPRSVEGMVAVVRRWTAIAEGEGMPLLFETHRHGLLNDLYPTLDLLDHVPELRLCADLSHFVVDREFALPIDEAAQAMVSQVLDRSWAFQGRIATNEQVQVQIGFPRHQGWVEQFFAWWAQGLASWRARSGPDATLTFLCELGPPPYAITGADGLELSERWEEALIIRKRVRDLWTSLAPAGKGPASHDPP